MPIQIDSMKGLVDMVNRDLGDFCRTFAYRRKVLAGKKKASDINILFKYEDASRDWAINSGGGTEIQYHLYMGKRGISYGLGFNTQYVPYASDKSPSEYMRPFGEAFLELKAMEGQGWKDKGFDWISGRGEELLQNPVSGEFTLYGKRIAMSGSAIEDEDYRTMLEDIKGTLYDIYTKVFEKAGEKARGSDSPEAPGLWMIWEDTKAQDTGRISMGDSVSETISDYSQFSTYEQMREAYQQAKGNTDVSVPHAYWQFMKSVREGDTVVMFRNRKSGGENSHELLGWGRFTSGLINDASSSNPLQRTVEWVRWMDNPVVDDMTHNSIFFHGTSHEQAAHIRKLLGITDNGKDKMKHKKYIDYLKSNHNLILTGAPGTGKTYLAKAIAEEMGAETEFVQFHPSYDYTDFVEGLRPTASGSFERKDGIFKEFCRKAITNLEESLKSEETLAEERSLSDRIADFLSCAIDEGTEFTLKSGNRFLVTDFDEKRIRIQSPDNEKSTEIVLKMSEIKELIEKDVPLENVLDIRKHYGRRSNTQQDSYTFALCSEIKKTKAQATATVSRVSRKDFVFIIDEINRGELSKIFGELFFSIDPGYRGRRGLVKTQYQNLVDEDDEFADGFHIPDNVYILGTMNDIDRSVESMDFAMRRRFSWLEVKPEDRTEMLDELGSHKTEAVIRMTSLNAAISATDGLGPAFQVGPAYFLKLSDGDFGRLWDMNIGPLLTEYLRGFRGADKKLEAFREAYERKAGKETGDNGTEFAE